MKRAPAGGLPPRIYLPIVAICMLAVCGVIAIFLKTAFATTGSVLGPSARQEQAAPAGARDSVLGGTRPGAAPGASPVPAAPAPMRTVR